MNSLDIGAACVDVTAPVLVVEVCVCFERSQRQTVSTHSEVHE